MAVSYAGNKNLISSNVAFGVKFNFGESVSLVDFGKVLVALDQIFAQSSKSVGRQLEQANNKKIVSALIVKEFKTGSLIAELQPFFENVASDAVAGAVVAVFGYAIRRAVGKVTDHTKDKELLGKIDPHVLSESRAREAASEAVSATTAARKALRDNYNIHKLNVTINIAGINVSISGD